MADPNVIQQVANLLSSPGGSSQPFSFAPQQPVPWAAPAQPDQTNLNAATSDLALNPQERFLYQTHLNNLYGPGGVDNMNGSRSTLYQMSHEINGQTYNLPTVYGGQILSPPDALDRARQIGLNKFPSYANEADAESRYQKMHDYMERDTGRYMQLRGRR